VARGYWVPLWEVIGCVQEKGRGELRALPLLRAARFFSSYSSMLYIDTASCEHYYSVLRPPST